MKYLKIILLLILLLNSSLLLAQKNWQVLELGEIDSVFLRLKVKKYACLADTNWIGFEFENKSGDTLKSESYCQYAIDKIYNGGTGNLTQEANFYPFMADGYAHFKSKISPTPIKVFESLSNEGSAMLGLPKNTNDTLLVKCSLNFTLPLTNGKKLEIKDYKFTFYWYYPSSKQLVSLRNRLRYYLTHEQKGNKSYYYFHTLLTNPTITDSLPVQEFLNALKTYQKNMGFYGNNILAYLDRTYPENKIVIHFFQKMIDDDNDNLFEYLYRMPQISCELVHSLLRNYHKHMDNRLKRSAIISIYRQNIHPKYGNTYAQHLWQPFIRDNPILKTKPDSLSSKNLQAWLETIHTLGNIGDTNTIKFITPFLKNKGIINNNVCIHAKYRKTNIRKARGDIQAMCIRICDFALESILNIKGKKASFLYIPAGINNQGQRIHNLRTDTECEEFYQRVTKIRDELIAEIIAECE